MLSKFCVHPSLLLQFLAILTLATTAASAQDPAARPELVLQQGHWMFVSDVACMRDGTVVSAGWDREIKLWNAQTGEVRRSTVTGSFPLQSVDVSGDDRIAAGSGQPAGHEIDETPGEVRVWSAHTGAPLGPAISFPHPVWQVRFSPDGQTVAATSYEELRRPGAVGTPRMVQGVVRLLEVPGGKLRRTFSIPDGQFTALAFSPDGVLLATAESAAVHQRRGAREVQPGGDVGGIRLWDLRDGTVRRRILAARTVQSLEFSPDGKTLLTAEGSDGIAWWDVATGELQRREAKDAERFGAQRAVFSPDGKTVATLLGLGVQVELRDARTGVSQGRFGTQPAGVLQQASSLCFTTDGRRIVVGGGFITNGTLWTWETESRRLKWSTGGSVAMAQSLAVAPRSDLLAVAVQRLLPHNGSYTATADVWDLRTGSFVRRFEGGAKSESSVVAVAFSPDGTRLAAGCEDGGPRLWEVRTGALVQTLRGADRGVYHVAFAPNGQAVAGIDSSGIRLWNPATGRLLKSTPDQPDAIAFSADSRLLAAGSNGEGRGWVEVSRATDSKVLWTQRGEKTGAQVLAFSRDDALLAVGGRDGKIRLREARTGRLVATLPAGDFPMALAFTGPDTLVSVDNRGATRMWSVRSHRLLRTILNAVPVLSATVSADGRRIILAEHGGSIAIVDLKRGSRAATLVMLPADEGASPEWIAYTPDGRYAASAGAERFIRWRVGDRLFPASAYSATYHQPAAVSQALEVGG